MTSETWIDMVNPTLSPCGDLLHCESQGKWLPDLSPFDSSMLNPMPEASFNGEYCLVLIRSGLLSPTYDIVGVDCGTITKFVCELDCSSPATCPDPPGIANGTNNWDGSPQEETNTIS